MRLLALYTEYTLSIMRRITAPFSVLSERDYAFSFMQVPHFSAGLSYGYDATILPNWILTDEELSELTEAVHTSGRFFVYDLSDPALLENSQVRRILPLMHLVTVPTAFLKKEIETITQKSAVVPSCVDTEYFKQARSLPLSKQPVIGCFGPYDWYLVKEALVRLQERHPALIILAGPQATRALGTELVREMSVTPLSWATLAHSCYFGLCPLDGARGFDPIWELEYGIFCRPVVKLASRFKETQAWIDRIETFLQDREERAACGQAAYLHANALRSSQVADLYLRAYHKKLPHLFLSV